MRESLKTDRTGKAVDGEASDGGKARVGGGRVRSAMHHGVGDFDAGGESVEDEAAGFLFEDLDQLSVRGEVFVVAEDGCGEVAVEGASGAKHVLRVVAVDQQGVGAEDFAGKLGLGDELIKTHGE